MDEIIFCKTGGCGAKLGAGALSKVLEKLPKKENKNLIVGFDSHDDGAVYKINDTQAIISTLDFFGRRPIYIRSDSCNKCFK